VDSLKVFLEAAREIRDPNGAQVWVVLLSPDLVFHLCERMGWELATIGRNTRAMQAGEIEEKQKEERRIVLP
jgi:hypothetical protein